MPVILIAKAAKRVRGRVENLVAEDHADKPDNQEVPAKKPVDAPKNAKTSPTLGVENRSDYYYWTKKIMARTTLPNREIL
eukprot:CAMPEP_0172449832 /NCGR_PEP_ID=MMETSP1065-20121228/8430_1 /TAXON_ID=265537 /ORGANISM="Amphiprora paludosa, Strain CCMP125" /LENGTH=79 /DNA_ID=CAMNT_0013201581 /DNA_START=50 /DNA_END=287 /DNA_ORIENTATION=+